MSDGQNATIFEYLKKTEIENLILIFPVPQETVLKVFVRSTRQLKYSL